MEFFEDLFHLNCGCKIFVDVKAYLSCGRHNVEFVDVVVFSNSDLQQVSKLSGFLLYSICTCVTNIIFMKGEWMYLSYFYVLCMDFSTYISWSIICLLYVFVVQVEEYGYVEMFYIFLYINTLLFIEHNGDVSSENYSCRQVSSVKSAAWVIHHDTEFLTCHEYSSYKATPNFSDELV